MFGDKRVAVVIPAYNEERLVGRAIEQIPQFVDRIIVIDDASSDQTALIARRWSAKRNLICIRHEVNQGVGGAIVTGYRKALELGDDVVAVMAGDAQMDPMDLPRLIEPVLSDGADYVKGDRLAWPGVWRVMPLARFIGNHLFSLLTKLTSGYGQIRDSQCGYTVITAHTLAKLDLDELYTRYGFPNDVLAHLYSVGARLAQVPVRPIYASEQSGISLLTGLVGMPWVMLCSMWRRWRRAGTFLLAKPVRRKN